MENNTNRNSRYQEVLVAPSNARRETFLLLLAIGIVVLLMFLRFFMIAGKSDEKYLRSYQRFDNILTTNDQKIIYQSLLSCVREVEMIRDKEGLWPEAELLQMEQIPPFDIQFLPRGLKDYTWSSYDGGSWVDYVGQNQTESVPVTFLLRLIDLHAEYHPHPHPGIDYDPNMKVAVQVWIYPEPNRPYPGERLPEAGWYWVVRPDDWTLKKPADKRIQQAAEKKEAAASIKTGGG